MVFDEEALPLTRSWRPAWFRVYGVSGFKVLGFWVNGVWGLRFMEFMVWSLGFTDCICGTNANCEVPETQAMPSTKDVVH